MLRLEGSVPRKQNLKIVGSRAVSDHGYGSRGIAHRSRKQVARLGDIHFRDEVVVGGCFVDDAFEDGICLSVSSHPAIYFCQAEVDKHELLSFVPILKDRWIGQNAADAPI